MIYLYFSIFQVIETVNPVEMRISRNSHTERRIKHKPESRLVSWEEISHSSNYWSAYLAQ